MKTDKKSLLRENRLKETPIEAYSVSDYNFLEKQGIINWIWPESYGNWFQRLIMRWLRKLMTWLFKFLNYKRHDLGFWKQIWFHKANWGLLKYSHISLAKEYETICKQKWYKKLYLIPKYHITLPIKSWIISWAYNAVESKVWRKAYNNAK